MKAVKIMVWVMAVAIFILSAAIVMKFIDQSNRQNTDMFTIYIPKECDVEFREAGDRLIYHTYGSDKACGKTNVINLKSGKKTYISWDGKP